MIPNNIDDWNYELIEKLVRQGFFETDNFDFKGDLPYPKDENKKENLEQTVCAFANTEGGFLIFGVKDDRGLSYEDRLMGIEPSRDFIKEFGDKIKNIQPHIYFDFKNPPIRTPNNKNVVHIIKIPQSPERPHITKKREFYYRVNGTNNIMSYPQIKESFLNEEQRRQKLRLLFIELLSNKEQSTSMIIPEEKIKESYSLVTLDSSVLQTLLVDTYPIIIREEELIRLLITIREKIKVINNKIRIFYSQISLPLTGKKEIVKSHNEYINQNVKGLISLLDRSLKILQERYGLSNPFR